MSDTPVASRPIRMVSTIMGTVVGLTFLFGFGNVLNLALRLGVPVWIAPLIAPALDLTVLGLLMATRHLALNGVSGQELRPPRRLLLFASVVTLALNVAEPMIAGHSGRALFDAVGPLLMIGWAEVGPGLLQVINSPCDRSTARAMENRHAPHRVTAERSHPLNADSRLADGQSAEGTIDHELITRARMEDAKHWESYRRPISAETLRKRLRVSATRSRMLVAAIRSER